MPRIASRISSSVLVVLVPLLIVFILMSATGKDLGALEIGLVMGVWVIGLALVWL